MSVHIQGPIDLSTATKVGRRLFKKQILPFKEINYKGRKIKFDEAFVTDLAKSFKEGAYDQVPVVFADGANAHNMDPRNFGGKVVDLTVESDGLYGTIEATKETAVALKKNPELGVSARIIEQVDKSDGRSFPRAVNHVLLTMDPRVTGMKPWETVDLSSDGTDIGEVINLTALTIEKETDMGKQSAAGEKTQGVITIDLSALSDEDRKFVTDLGLVDLSEEVADEDDEDVDTEEHSLEEDDADADDADADADEDEDEDEDDESTDLSNSALHTEQNEQIQKMRIDLANERWQSERKDLARAGVPPFLLDLAEPILASPDPMVIDLSNADEPVNAQEVIRSMITGIKGMVDLSEETGHQMDLSNGEDTSDAILKAWDEEYGQA